MSSNFIILMIEGNSTLPFLAHVKMLSAPAASILGSLLITEKVITGFFIVPDAELPENYAELVEIARGRADLNVHIATEDSPNFKNLRDKMERLYGGLQTGKINLLGP